MTEPTPCGRNLGPVLEALGRWGSPLMFKRRGSEEFRGHWLAFPAEHLLTDGSPDESPVTIEVGIGDDVVGLETSGGDVLARPGPGRRRMASGRGRRTRGAALSIRVPLTRTRLTGLLLAAAVITASAGAFVLLDGRDERRAPDRHARFEDRQRRFRIDIPPGWILSPLNLEPTLGDPPWEILAAATYPMRPGGSCAQYPVNAIEDLPADGALLVIQEPRDGREKEMPHRPNRFSPRPTSDDSADCLSKPKTFEHYFFDFRDGERGFYVYAAFGVDATAARMAETWAMLDSFTLT